LNKMEREVPSFEAPRPPLIDELAEALLGDAAVDPALLARLQDPAWMASRASAERTLRDQDWANQGRYQRHNAELIAAGTRPDIVFMGDSNTELWALADATLFTPGRVCRGIAGQTSPQMLVRFQADVLALRPRAVHLLAGTNDIAGNTGPTTPYRYQCNMLAMVRLAQAHDIKVVLGLLPPLSFRSWIPDLQPAPWVTELNLWLRELAAERGCELADYYAALDDGTGNIRAGCSHDGVHPNRRGLALMRQSLEPLLERLGV
jgi:lysophospholipase L1-like esterase